MSDESSRPPLRRIGGIWKPREGSRSLGSGVITIGGLRQRFLIFENDRRESAQAPDFVVLASKEPEPTTEPAPPRAGRERREGRPAFGESR
jgi:hypothetical protein